MNQSYHKNQNIRLSFIVVTSVVALLLSVLLSQTINTNLSPQESKAFVESLNQKIGVNVALDLGEHDVDAIINYQQNTVQIPFANYTSTMVSDPTTASKTALAIKKAKSAGVKTIVRFCYADKNVCKFKTYNVAVNDNHPIVKFCLDIAKSVSKSDFICATGPNDPEFESVAFGYPDNNLTKIANDSYEIGKYLKSKSIQTGTPIINGKNGAFPDFLKFYARDPSLVEAYDYLLLNIFDSNQITSFDSYSKNKIIDNKSLQEIVAQTGIKLIALGYGTTSTSARNFETFLKSTYGFCADKNVHGLLIFRANSELLQTHYSFLYKEPTIDKGTGNLTGPLILDKTNVRELINECQKALAEANNQSAISLGCGPMDVDGDNKLSIPDLAIFAKKYRMTCNDAKEYLQTACGATDFNNDGEVNPPDLAKFAVNYGKHKCS